jgi:signal transduction histidine kinase
MPATLRTRLFIGFLVVLLLGMGLAGFLAWLAVEAQYLDTQRENLLAQAQISAAALGGLPLPSASSESYSQSSNLAPGIHTRVLGKQGAVVIGLPLVSQPAPPAENSILLSPDELLARPEIAQALRGQTATAIRTIPAGQNRRVLYAAAPILADNGSVIGLVYLATPLPAAGLPAPLLLNLGEAVGAAIVLSLLAGHLLARRIARPVEEITQAVKAVNAGDLTQHVSAISNIREFISLGRSFNAMIDSLRQSDHSKNAFLADVTHELRTPLTVILGTIETLEDGALDDSIGRGPLLASMKRETERLIRLVNDLLVLARFDAGTLKVNLQPLDLGGLARARCAHLAILAARRQIRFKITDMESATPSCVLGDADRLSQVLDNLLENAIHYSPEGAAINITIWKSNNSCHCAVQDNGPGIAAKHQPYIFERFYRTDASRNRQTGGVGLGLAIARALILAQGGTISVESEEGSGSTLHFCLPRTGNCHTAA